MTITDLFSLTIVLSFWECHKNGIMQFVIFRDWLLLLSILPLSCCVHQCLSNPPPFFLTEQYSLWISHCLFIHSLKDILFVLFYLLYLETLKNLFQAQRVALKHYYCSYFKFRTNMWLVKTKMKANKKKQCKREETKWGCSPLTLKYIWRQ